VIVSGTLVAAVLLALLFDFTNGFHDTANAIATSVSTRALDPPFAVLFAGVLNFAGAFVSLKVAATVATGIVSPEAITVDVVLAGLVAAIAWNLLTWLLGLPSSSSHALIGGVLGSAVAAAGWEVVDWRGLCQRVLLPSLAAPFLGIALAGLVSLAIVWLFRNARPRPVNAAFRRLQVVSAGFVAFTHGTNDAQKTMGVIALALVVADPGRKFEVPLWVVVAAASAMAAGTYAGGWRVIRTLGQRVVQLQPHQGFAAETATATILFATGHLGFPVSTTHTISGGVLGAGATKRLSAVRWGIAGDIVTAWLFTLPIAALVGAGLEVVVAQPGGAALLFALALAAAIAGYAIGAGIPLRRRRSNATSADRTDRDDPVGIPARNRSPRKTGDKMSPRRRAAMQRAWRRSTGGRR
jgi:PiT family inorganic phosphate transporter